MSAAEKLDPNPPQKNCPFPIIKNTSDNPELATLYDEIVKAGFGQNIPLNWFMAQGTRPDILKATWGLCKAILVEGKLPATIKQLIAISISVHNECHYCSVTHTGALDALGVPQEVVQSCIVDVDSAKLPRAHKDIIKFAVKAASTPNDLTDEDFQTLKNNGMENEEIMEVVMMAACTKFLNTWAEASGIQLDSMG